MNLKKVLSQVSSIGQLTILHANKLSPISLPSKMAPFIGYRECNYDHKRIRLYSTKTVRRQQQLPQTQKSCLSVLINIQNNNHK